MEECEIVSSGTECEDGGVNETLFSDDENVPLIYPDLPQLKYVRYYYNFSLIYNA